MKIVIENADENDFNELAQLARIGRIHTFYLTDEDEGSQDKWIPVSERLPDKNGECLVSLDFGDVNIDAFVDGIFVCYLGNVIAWQPLPEPYKKGGAE